MFQKGYDYLVNVASIVLKKHPDWCWDIYGNDIENNKTKLNGMIEEKLLSDNVVYQGTASNLYDLYGNYSFMVVTSRWEGLPMTMIEAKIKNYL